MCKVLITLLLLTLGFAQSQAEEWKPIGTWPFEYKNFQVATVYSGVFKIMKTQTPCNIHLGNQALWFVQNDTLTEAQRTSIIRVEFNNGDVFIVVGDTFEEEVIKNNKDIVVLFYSPWCYHCKALLPKYEEVAKILKPKNKNLILTKINAIDNEVESIDNYDFPQIKLYPGNKKDNPPIDYNGDKSVDDIIKFIKNNVAYPIYIDNEKDKNAEL